MTYFKILVLALALFTFLRLTGAYLPIFLENKRLKTFFVRLFPAIELFVWLAFVIWSSSELFNKLVFYPLIMTVVVVIIMVTLAWYLLRDFISGFVLRVENAFEPGQVIKTPFTQGTIKKIGYRSVEIITSSGEYQKIPYTLLMNSSIIRPQDNSKWVENVVNLEFSSTLDASKIKSLLKRRLMEMPWIVSQESIKLELVVHKPHGTHGSHGTDGTDGTDVTHGSDDTHGSDGSDGTQEIESLDSSITKYYAAIHFYSITPESVIKTEENLKQLIKKSIQSSI